MDPTLKDILDAVDDLRFEIDDIKDDVADIKMAVQEILDKMTEAEDWFLFVRTHNPHHQSE